MLTIDAAAEFVQANRQQGRRVVLTTGVFDLLHPGHVRFLRAARAEGDVLMVAINSDRSVRNNKGPTRPIVPEHERAEILEALSAVDAVVVFDDETPEAVIDRLQPHVLVKGADRAEDAIAGRGTVEAGGRRVVRVPIEAEWSTSAIIEKARAVSDR